MTLVRRKRMAQSAAGVVGARAYGKAETRAAARNYVTQRRRGRSEQAWVGPQQAHRPFNSDEAEQI